MICDTCGSTMQDSVKTCSFCGNLESTLPVLVKNFLENTILNKKYYAGFWVRAMAVFLDSLVFLGIVFMLSLIGIFIANILGFPYYKIRDDIVLGWIVFCIFAYFVYRIFFTVKYGATFGKAIMGIKVISLQDKTLSWGTVFIREIFGKFLSELTTIGYVITGFTEKKQALHDMIVNTTVVYDTNAQNQYKIFVLQFIKMLGFGVFLFLLLLYV